MCYNLYRKNEMIEYNLDRRKLLRRGFNEVGGNRQGTFSYIIPFSNVWFTLFVNAHEMYGTISRGYGHTTYNFEDWKEELQLHDERVFNQLMMFLDVLHEDCTIEKIC